MGEVEAELVRAHGRAGLPDVLAERLPQRLVEEVRGRVVRHRREAHAPRHHRADAVALGEPIAPEEQSLIVPEPVRLHELGARPRLVVALDPPVIAHLAAARRVEGRLAELREEVPVVEPLERADLREHVRLRVAHELRLEAGSARELRGALDVALDPGPRHVAVPLHLRVVAIDVDRAAPLLGELHRELEREAVGRREREGVLAGDRPLRRELLEELHAAVERLLEALLLGPDDLRDLVRALPQLGVGVLHPLHDDAGERVERLEPDALRLDHRAPDDPAEHVAAALVRRGHAVRDEERRPATVVGEDPVRLRGDRRVAVGHARLGLDPRHDPLVAVRLVHGADVLEDRGAALESQPGVDVLRRERGQRPVGMLLVLHEDEVPELEEPVAARARRRAVGLAAAVLLAPVPVELRVRPAGAGSADRPEVLDCRQRHDPLGWHPRGLPRLDRDLVRAEPELRIARVDA